MAINKEKIEEEIQQKANKVYELMLQGYDVDSGCTMVGCIKGTDFGKVKRRAKKMFDVWVQNSVEEDKAEIVGKYMDIYRRSHKMGNYKLCKDILDSVADIQKVKETSVIVKNVVDVDWQ